MPTIDTQGRFPMSNSTPVVAKIKLKVGTMELEYEGDPSFLTGGIEALLVTMGGLAPTVPAEALPTQSENDAPVTSTHSQPSPSGTPLNFSTSTIAAHLDAKSGPELAICAMAQLEIVQGKPTSARTEIIAQMRTASSYYNDNMSSNLSKILTGLVRSKKVNEISKDTYALHATERKQIEAKLAEA